MSMLGGSSPSGSPNSHEIAALGQQITALCKQQAEAEAAVEHSRERVVALATAIDERTTQTGSVSVDDRLALLKLTAEHHADRLTATERELAIVRAYSAQQNLLINWLISHAKQHAAATRAMQRTVLTMLERLGMPDEADWWKDGPPDDDEIDGL
jgi:hypothetical protein